MLFNQLCSVERGALSSGLCGVLTFKLQQSYTNTGFCSEWSYVGLHSNNRVLRVLIKMSLLGRFHIIPYVAQRRINPLCRAQSRLLHSNLHKVTNHYTIRLTSSKLEIGQSQIEQFRKDGFLIVPELISGDLATTLRSRYY